MFIVLYGINNIGKTTQAKLLSAKLKSVGIKNEYIKYPLYDLAPTGAILNNYLRQGNKYNLSAQENQIINALNKTQFEPKLKEKLDSGITIIAEDYIGTSLAWGGASSVPQELLKKINSHLVKEDLSILFNGNRFKKTIEKNNKHENDEELINKVKDNFLYLAQENKWEVIDANESIDKIHDMIYQKVKKCL